MKKLLLIPALLVLTSCTMSEEAQIKQAISDANHCETKADCTVVTGQCPFGCYVLAHKDEAASLSTLIMSYQSTCTYSCIQQPDYDCVANKCVFPSLEQGE